MKCSIVIRAYNVGKHIGRLLAGIRQQTVKDVEIILVDSGSTDKTVSVAESFGARLVRIPSAEFTFGGRSIWGPGFEPHHGSLPRPRSTSNKLTDDLETPETTINLAKSPTFCLGKTGEWKNNFMQVIIRASV